MQNGKNAANPWEYTSKGGASLKTQNKKKEGEGDQN